MAVKCKRNKDATALTSRVWVLEQRQKYANKKEMSRSRWHVFDIYSLDFYEESRVAGWCRLNSEQYPECEHRYRTATLTFDDDGSDATIY